MTKTPFVTKLSVPLVFATLALGSIVGQPVSAQIAVPVPQNALDATLAACTRDEACIAAVEALVAQLIATNPGVDPATVLGSVVAAVASAYNTGTVPGAVASVVLDAVASVAAARGATQVAAAVAVAVAAVGAGDAIDIEAVAEASGSPT